MSLTYHQDIVSRVEREIADIQKKIADETKKELDKQRQIDSINRSVTKATSASSLQSKNQQVRSHQSEIIRIQSKKADLHKRLADKSKDLSTKKHNLLKEEAKERLKIQREQKAFQQTFESNFQDQIIKLNMTSTAPNKIELSSRRNILDGFIVTRISWFGSLEQGNFLGRLFDLSRLPSNDARFATADEDIQKHTVLNNDWPEEWVFTDRRFNILHVTDKLFLEFLCLTIHPTVRSNHDQVVALLEIYNNNLTKDGFEIFKSGDIAGRPTFGFREVKPIIPSAIISGKETKLALVIGCSNYTHGPFLINPTNDASAMEDKLKGLGFDVTKIVNPNQKELKICIDQFGEKLKGTDTGLFYFAGHGVQLKGMNYLIPVDANLKTELMVEYDCVEVGRVLSYMEESNTKVNIVILDACRDNPFERSWGRGINQRGLTTMNAPSGSLIAYSTSPGKTASDGDGANGLYTDSLLEHIGSKQVSIMTMFQRVRSDVMTKSKKEQTPWEATSLTADYFFNP